MQAGSLTGQNLTRAEGFDRILGQEVGEVWQVQQVYKVREAWWAQVWIGYSTVSNSLHDFQAVQQKWAKLISK